MRSIGRAKADTDARFALIGVATAGTVRVPGRDRRSTTRRSSSHGVDLSAATDASISCGPVARIAHENCQVAAAGWDEVDRFADLAGNTLQPCTLNAYASTLCRKFSSPLAQKWNATVADGDLHLDPTIAELPQHDQDERGSARHRQPVGTANVPSRTVRVGQPSRPARLGAETYSPCRGQHVAPTNAGSFVAAARQVAGRPSAPTSCS
jgi:hypothetical protein